jgi:8-oxo-dGTP pyrophosphatase MutT (NUDIX family)
METEKGVIIVLYKQSRRSNRFALLKRKKNWEGWEIPKGHLEDDGYEHTVKLELREETGIDEDDIEEITDMEETVSWEYEEDGEEFRKEYRAFLVRVDEDTDIDISHNPHEEHEQGFFLKKEDAESLITYENNIEILEKGVEAIDSQ